MKQTEEMLEEVKLQARMNVELDNSDGGLVWYEGKIQQRQSEDDNPVVEKIIPLPRGIAIELVTRAEHLHTANERLRAVVAQQASAIAALRDDMARIWDIGHEQLRGTGFVELQYAIQDMKDIAVRHTQNDALDAKPDDAPAPVENAAAEPTIKVGDRVVTIYGHHGQVTRIDDGRPNPYTVRFAAAPTDSSEFFAGQYARNEIKPA